MIVLFDMIFSSVQDLFPSQLAWSNYHGQLSDFKKGNRTEIENIIANYRKIFINFNVGWKKLYSSIFSIDEFNFFRTFTTCALIEIIELIFKDKVFNSPTWRLNSREIADRMWFLQFFQWNSLIEPDLPTY